MISAELTGMQAFIAAMDATMRRTKRDAREAVTFGAIMFARSARAGTPRARKFRQPMGRTNFDRPTREAYGLRGQAFIFEIRRQPPKATTTVFARTRQSPVALITNRGLGKRSWGWMLRDLGKSGGDLTAPEPGAQTGRRHVYIRKDLQATDPGILLVNKLTYLDAASPGLANLAAQKAANTMITRIERGLGRSG